MVEAPPLDEAPAHIAIMACLSSSIDGLLDVIAEIHNQGLTCDVSLTDEDGTFEKLVGDQRTSEIIQALERMSNHPVSLGWKRKAPKPSAWIVTPATAAALEQIAHNHNRPNAPAVARVNEAVGHNNLRHRSGTGSFPVVAIAEVPDDPDLAKSRAQHVRLAAVSRTLSNRGVSMVLFSSTDRDASRAIPSAFVVRRVVEELGLDYFEFEESSTPVTITAEAAGESLEGLRFADPAIVGRRTVIIDHGIGTQLEPNGPFPEDSPPIDSVDEDWPLSIDAESKHVGIVACGATPTWYLERLIEDIHAQGWTCKVWVTKGVEAVLAPATKPGAEYAEWVDRIERLTGHPIGMRDGKAGPSPDAWMMIPATINSVSRLAWRFRPDSYVEGAPADDLSDAPELARIAGAIEYNVGRDPGESEIPVVVIGSTSADQAMSGQVPKDCEFLSDLDVDIAFVGGHEMGTGGFIADHFPLPLGIEFLARRFEVKPLLRVERLAYDIDTDEEWVRPAILSPRQAGPMYEGLADLGYTSQSNPYRMVPYTRASDRTTAEVDVNEPVPAEPEQTAAVDLGPPRGARRHRRSLAPDPDDIEADVEAIDVGDIGVVEPGSQREITPEINRTSGFDDR